MSNDDEVNSPHHYRSHPSGVECIDIAEHMSFNLGNAMKYIWRADLKGKQYQDLMKAVWYINREMDRLVALQVEERDAWPGDIPHRESRESKL